MEAKRIENLKVKIKEAGLGGVLVCPSKEMIYLAGFSPMMCERFQGLFVPAEGESFYICNLLYQSEVEENIKGLKVYTWRDGEEMTDVVKEHLNKSGMSGKKIGVNSTAQAFNVLEMMDKLNETFVNAKGVFEEARIIKTREEIDDLRKAAEIADAAFDAVVKFIKPGMAEREIADFLTNTMSSLGGAIGFCIVASGPNGSYPHYTGKDRIIQNKDLIVLDFGCVYKNMNSDMTRTVFVGGYTDEQKKVYDIVLKSNLAGEAAAVDGAYIPDVDKAARDVIDNEGYGEYFTTRLGHGIGYMGHEAPDIKKNNYRKLEKGMAFSIEPGIYLTGNFGVRIEDIVVIGLDGKTEILNKAAKNLIVI